MKNLKDINTQGMFYFDTYELPGVLTINKNSVIEVKINLNFEIDKYENGPTRVSVVHGVLRNENERITILDSLIHKSFWSSNGITEYTIRSNVMVLGLHIENKEDFKLKNICIISSDLNKFIGNSFLSAKVDIKTETWSLEIHNNQIINLGSKNGISIILNAFYNFGKYSLRSNISIEQMNSLKFEFENGYDIYEAIRFVKTIENFFSFIFQKDSEVDEVVFFSDETYGEKTISTFKHIYYVDNERENKDFDEEKSLLQRPFALEEIGKYIFNWVDLVQNITYLNYFIRFYSSNKYIEQRIIGQINLIEAFHKYFHGTKKEPKEKDDIIKRTCNQITVEEDRKMIESMLNNKNGFGLRKKIADLAQKANYHFDDEDLIEHMSTLRSSFAHGSIISEITNSMYIKMNSALTEIINTIMIQEMGSDFKETTTKQ